MGGIASGERCDPGAERGKGASRGRDHESATGGEGDGEDDRATESATGGGREDDRASESATGGCGEDDRAGEVGG